MANNNNTKIVLSKDTIENALAVLDGFKYENNGSISIHPSEDELKLAKAVLRDAVAQAIFTEYHDPFVLPTPDPGYTG